MAKRDYYELLGISRDADEKEIKRAYRKLAMKYHPDRNPDDTDAENKFKEASEAYEILADDSKRAAYDQFGPAGVDGQAGGGFGGGGGLSGGGGASGMWGQRGVEADLSLDNLDASLLMWDMRRSLNVDPLPDRRSVVEFHYEDQPASRRSWWLIVEADGHVDLCSVDPGFEVDLFATTDLRTMTSGRGQFSMEFDHYAPCPNNVAEEVIAEAKAGKEAK